jgi:hypothetical protein
LPIAPDALHDWRKITMTSEGIAISDKPRHKLIATISDEPAGTLSEAAHAVSRYAIYQLLMAIGQSPTADDVMCEQDGRARVTELLGNWR